ncbi:hypothetical protein D3C85_836710 [compost metagenome]
MQQGKQPQLCEPAEEGAADAGQQPEHSQLQAEQHHGFPARQPEAAQQGTGIEPSGGEAGCRQRHRHAGQQHRHQAGHVQVAFGFAQGATDLSITVAGVLQALVGGKPRFDQLPIRLECLSAASP